MFEECIVEMTKHQFSVVSLTKSFAIQGNINSSMDIFTCDLSVPQGAALQIVTYFIYQ